MEADLGWSRVEITGAFSMGMGVAALAALPVGRWIDRHGARALMTAGSCLGTALLLVWSRVESPRPLRSLVPDGSGPRGHALRTCVRGGRGLVRNARAGQGAPDRDARRSARQHDLH